jgi:hypothetical protein
MARIGGELKIAVQVALRDSFIERLDQLLDVEKRDHALHLLSRHEPHRRRDDHAEQSVAADHVPEELRSLGAAAGDDFAVAGDDFERLDILDERAGVEAAPVNVRCDGSADRESIRAGLLLADAPRRYCRVRADQIAADHVGPRDACLYAQQSVSFIEAERAIEPSHVQQSRTCEELLSAHGVPAARDCDRMPAAVRLAHGVYHVVDAAWLDRACNLRAVQCRVRVVDFHRASKNTDAWVSGNTMR